MNLKTKLILKNTVQKGAGLGAPGFKRRTQTRTGKPVPKKGTPEYREYRQMVMRRCIIRKKYGLSIEEYESMVEQHCGRCDICGARPQEPPVSRSTLDLDHCHDTGLFRGFLCNHCNLGLGNFKDNPTRLKAAIEYLLRAAKGAA